MGMTKFKGHRKHERVFHGRHKGNSETHCANEDSREGYDKMKWNSFVPYVCDACEHESYVHKLEMKIHRCPKCGT